MRLGEVIKAYRDSHEMSMDLFAERAGLTKAYISMLENGNKARSGGYPKPSIKTYRSCAHAMNMDVNDLLASTEESIRISDPAPGNQLNEDAFLNYVSQLSRSETLELAQKLISLAAKEE